MTDADILVAVLVSEVTDAATCFECTWTDQELNEEELADKLEELRTEKRNLMRDRPKIQWMPYNAPYRTSKDIPTYPTPEVLKSQCGTCVTGNSKVCVRWHYFTDVSNPRGKTVNVTWGCARATQLGCWRERTDLTTKEVCLCNYDDCNSTFVYRSSTAVAFICALLSTFMRKLGIS